VSAIEILASPWLVEYHYENKIVGRERTCKKVGVEKLEVEVDQTDTSTWLGMRRKRGDKVVGYYT
jgi:hypothetical protein